MNIYHIVYWQFYQQMSDNGKALSPGLANMKFMRRETPTKVTESKAVPGLKTGRKSLGFGDLFGGGDGRFKISKVGEPKGEDELME